MTPTRWQMQAKLFEAAIALPPSQRSAWLGNACAADPALRLAVEQMLAADDKPVQREPATSMLPWAQNRHWQTGMQVGTYRIVRRLGSGGMGEVYLAERSDGSVTQQVAIKRLQDGSNHPDAERRFLDERRFLAQLQHSNIARFLDAGTDPEGLPYAVMEYVPGQSITEYARTQGLTIEQRLRLFLRVADAVSYAHRQLIVHRDIKPANVLVDRHGEPRLLDFGISKALDVSAKSSSRATRTAFEFRAFSLQHAAPEQLRGEACGISCDVYSLGVLLYELLTESPPLDVDNLSYGEAERLILESLPTPPSRRNPASLDRSQAIAWRRKLQGDVDRIVLHALKKAPEQRYLSVDALSSDLNAHLSRETISLRVHHRWYRLARFCDRHRLPLLLVSALVVILASSSALLLRQSLQMKAERDSAMLAQARAESATELLARAFEGADPSRHAGAELSARAVLEFATRDLASNSQIDPQVQAVLAAKVAEVRRNLGDPQSAMAALDLASSIEATLPAETLSQNLAIRAQTQLDLGRLDDAETSLAEAEQVVAEFSDLSYRQQVLLQLGLAKARLLGARGQPHQTLQLLKRLYQQPAPASETLKLQVADAYAAQLSAMGQGDIAASILQQVLASIATPDTNPVGRRVLRSLARWNRKHGDLATAREFADRFLASTQLLYGEHHRVYAGALDLHARIAAESGDLELADTEFRASLRLLNTVGTEESKRTASMARNNYADFLLHRRNQPDLAVAEARVALSQARSVYPAEHLNIGFVCSTLAEALLAVSAPAEAYTVMLEAESIYGNFGDGNSVARAASRLTLAEAALADGRAQLAQQWLELARPVISQRADEKKQLALRILTDRLGTAYGVDVAMLEDPPVD